MTLDKVWAVVRVKPPGMVYGSTFATRKDAWLMAVHMLYGLNCDYEGCRKLMRRAGWRARRVRVELEE